MWPIKNFEKYSTAFQYTPKIFHEPHNNPVAPPPTHLMYSLLYVFWLKKRPSIKNIRNWWGDEGKRESFKMRTAAYRARANFCLIIHGYSN